MHVCTLVHGKRCHTLVATGSELPPPQHQQQQQEAATSNELFFNLSSQSPRDVIADDVADAMLVDDIADAMQDGLDFSEGHFDSPPSLTSSPRKTRHSASSAALTDSMKSSSSSMKSSTSSRHGVVSYKVGAGDDDEEMSVCLGGAIDVDSDVDDVDPRLTRADDEEFTILDTPGMGIGVSES